MALLFNGASVPWEMLRIPNGLQPAVCVDCRDLGKVDTKFGDKQMVLLIFELQVTNEHSDRYLLQKRYTKFIHKKLNLRKDMERWRGQPFQKETLARGFNLEDVVDIPAVICVEHRETDRGTCSHVESLLPAPDLQLQPSGKYEGVTETL